MAEFNAKQQPGLLDWMRAQMKACGAKTAVIGISGGKDSSVTAALSGRPTVARMSSVC